MPADLTDGEKTLLHELFYEPYYRRYAPRRVWGDETASFEHFLAEGLAANASPGPFLSIDYCAARLDSGETAKAGVALAWLRAGADQAFVPNRVFDPGYYDSKIPGRQRSGLSAFQHFIREGEAKGVPPCAPLEGLIAGEELRRAFSRPYSQYLALVPDGHEVDILDPAYRELIHKYIDNEYYVWANGLSIDPDDDRGVHDHFFSVGLLKGFRPHYLFNKDLYANRVRDRIETQRHENGAGIPPIDDIQVGESEFLHWYFIGRKERISPTPFYDDEIYMAHPDMAGAKGWGFDHFVIHGVNEDRRASVFFDANRARKIMFPDRVELEVVPAAADVFEGVDIDSIATRRRSQRRRLVPEQIRRSRRIARIRKSARIVTTTIREQIDSVLGPVPRPPKPLLRQYFMWPDRNVTAPTEDIFIPGAMRKPGDEDRRFCAVEDLAAELLRRVERLNSPTLRDVVRRAAEIEPLIHRPYGPRMIQLAPIKHMSAGAILASEKLVARLPVKRADIVVTIPSCRMSGAARVAGELTRGLRQLFPDATIVVFVTDLSDFEYPEWFDEKAHVVPVSDAVAPLRQDEKTACLLDLVRGLRAKRLFNANSRLCWDMTQQFSQQLAEMMEVYCYLFTWDLNEMGHKGGYPISYFEGVFEHADAFICDSTALDQELTHRFQLPRVLSDKLHVLHTPGQKSELSHAAVFETRRSERQGLRAIWAGRMDRQKRFDVVKAIALARPDIEILAWGKPVLGDSDELADLPGNIKLMGTYQSFDDMPWETSDFYLYTSQWDGVPTVLIDAASRGIATVASRVGGVGDVVTEDTGWPVEDVLDPAAYVAAIERMCADPAEVTRRATNLKRHVEERFSPEVYLESLRTIVGRD